MPKVTYKPLNGLKVPNPETGEQLKKGGELVEDSGYWRRQLRAGAVELVESKAAKKGASSKKTQPEDEAPAGADGGAK